MSDDDFRATERSHHGGAAATVRIEHVDRDGKVTALKSRLDGPSGEIIDAAVMRRAALKAFLAEQIADAKTRGVLFSVHLKTTMMRVSDPIIFGHVVRAYFKDVFEQHGDALKSVGVNPNDGLGALLKAIQALPEDERDAITHAIEAAYESGPPLWPWCDSDRGITNLHVPSDVIIDASMPAAIRLSGQMWDAEGDQEDAKFMIPDHSYAALYAETVEHCKQHGAFDPAKMGSTPNIGLMAQAAEEYGSHDKTFEIEAPGTVRVVDDAGGTLLEHDVEAGDIWRMCQTKDAPIQDWIRLAVTRARDTGTPAIFWLDETRAHDAEVLRKVRPVLAELDVDGVGIEILDVTQAARRTLERARANQDTISVTGNVLRDYLTDLFPILELGTSAKMLSIVPLMNGGGLFETGAGGSAPRHVQQFLQENHLRWDSLGRVPRARSFARAARRHRRQAPREATRRHTGPCDRPAARGGPLAGAEVGELDNRGSHFYLALYWAQALAEQDDDADLATRFADLARTAVREPGDDRRGAQLGARLDGRHRRLLPTRRRQGRGGDATERDPERGARGAGGLRPTGNATRMIDSQGRLQSLVCRRRPWPPTRTPDPDGANRPTYMQPPGRAARGARRPASTPARATSSTICRVTRRSCSAAFNHGTTAGICSRSST